MNFCEIAFLAVFLLQKLIFGHFWNCKKWNLVQKIIREIVLFHFTSFLAWPFLNYLAYCDIQSWLSNINNYFFKFQSALPVFAANPKWQWIDVQSRVTFPHHRIAIGIWMSTNTILALWFNVHKLQNCKQTAD